MKFKRKNRGYFLLILMGILLITSVYARLPRDLEYGSEGDRDEGHKKIHEQLARSGSGDRDEAGTESEEQLLAGDRDESHEPIIGEQLAYEGDRDEGHKKLRDQLVFDYGTTNPPWVQDEQRKKKSQCESELEYTPDGDRYKHCVQMAGINPLEDLQDQIDRIMDLTVIIPN